MGLDVDVPEPPDLTNRVTETEFGVGGSDELTGHRREELEWILRDGAWREAFEEWAEYTDLSESEFRIAHDLALFEEFDFYWDPDDERLRFVAPVVPDDWHEEPTDESLDADTVSRIDAALDDLGHDTVEVIEDLYVDWDGLEEEGVVWKEEMFGSVGSSEE